MLMSNYLMNSVVKSTVQNAQSILQNNDEPDIEQGLHDEESIDGGGLEMIKGITPIQYAAGGLAGTSTILSIIAMVIVGGGLIISAGLITMILGPYSFWQQRQLTDIQLFKETHESLVREIDHLEIENIRMTGLVEELDETVDRLEIIEDTFDTLNSLNIESLATFQTQVEESKDILAEMKQNLETDAMQNIITVVLNSDVDGDYKFDEDETEKLIDNLKAVNGIETNEVEFRKVLTAKNGSVDAIIDFLQDILNGNPNTHDGIFYLTP